MLWPRDRPTVTANLVLGRINGENPLAVLWKLDMNAAKRALENHVAPLGMDTATAAEAVIRVATPHGGCHPVSVERDKSPFMPFGGGGALHTGALIKEVGLSIALVRVSWGDQRARLRHR